jgi:hypothetical protein
MINNKNFKTVDADYPIMYFDKFLNDDESKALCDEIEDFSSFDDLVMNGRNRVNKGSENFYKYLEKYPNVLKLYNTLNSENSFLSFKDLLFNEKKINKTSWKPLIFPYKYSKDDYGEQHFNLFRYLRKSSIISTFFLKRINLDIDFSKSQYGYFRNAHRDRDTRVISFLIYLNTINEDEGGAFEIYKFKESAERLPRFPKENEVEKKKKFPPKAGQMFVFLSSPNSYHGVSKFISQDKSRIFIYGSYSLDRKVKWLPQ